MKTLDRIKIKYLPVLILGLLLTSCEDFLDKAPQVNITENDVFNKFLTFQGFIEDIYQCIVDPAQNNNSPMNWNFSDDVLITPASQFTSAQFDLGNYWWWTSGQASRFRGNVGSPSNASSSEKGYWQTGWYGIRKSNLALANVNKMVSGTQEEKDLINGQAYFFRGYFHFEILRAWGGVPYIDTVFAPTDQLTKPRLSYRATADRITADLTKAIQLLPASWDETTVGEEYLNQNTGRITKGAACGYLGKNLLYAASPLMNGLATGSYEYDTELCKQAAAAFYEVIKLAGQGYYGLETWGHYKDNFYTLQSGVVPRGKEYIFSNPVYGRRNSGNSAGDNLLSFFGGWLYAGPTENYVENFGMSNGLPIDAPGSGYDPGKRWENRDPRFYYNIVKDGDQQIKNVSNQHTFFKSYFVTESNKGIHRSLENSNSGYGVSKFRDIVCNSYDNGWTNFTYEVPVMRLADIYLMYAEAVNEAYGPTTVPANIPGGITAAEAVNIVRRRVEVSPGVPLPDVDAQFLNKSSFREIIRKERAVELAFEGHRWWDLRRWHVSHLMQYREKFVLDFDEAHTYFNKRKFSTIVFDDKHYWLPFPVDQAKLYPEFYQNPGW